MDGPPKQRAAYFRKRAAEARAKAEEIADDDARRMIREVAAMWDRLAEGIGKKKKPPSN